MLKHRGLIGERVQKVQFDSTNIVGKPVPTELYQGLVLVFVD